MDTLLEFVKKKRPGPQGVGRASGRRFGGEY
jgi:hypothetical protein